MKITYSTLIFLFMLCSTYSCSDIKKEDTTRSSTLKHKLPKANNSTLLFDQKCMICHITKGKTSETMLAPPFYEVKERYLKASMDKEDFIEIVGDWVKNPSADNVLIPDAVKHFGIMPNLNYSEKNINQISQYIYDNDMPKPEWFDAHEAEHGRKTAK